MVKVKPIGANQYVASKHGGILASGRLSTSAQKKREVAALDGTSCARPGPACIETLAAAGGIAQERQLAALSELWLQRAMTDNE